MTFEQSLKMSAGGFYQNSRNLHLIGIIGDMAQAINVVRNAPFLAQIWEVTTGRWAVAERSLMDEDGFVSLEFIHHGQTYVERVQYPVIVPLVVLANCLDVRFHRRAVLDHKAVQQMPLLRKGRFSQYVPRLGG